MGTRRVLEHGVIGEIVKKGERSKNEIGLKSLVGKEPNAVKGKVFGGLYHG